TTERSGACHLICWRSDLLYFYLFFFFSSRRRHTRWPRDWSSDVCSSDLKEWIARLRAQTGNSFPEKVTAFHPDMAVHGKFGKPRSEERRVGKSVDLGGRRNNKKKKELMYLKSDQYGCENVRCMRLGDEL